jgi:hypothetical protein
LRVLPGGGNGYRKPLPARGIRKRTADVAPESAKFPITGKRLPVSKASLFNSDRCWSMLF